MIEIKKKLWFKVGNAIIVIGIIALALFKVIEDEKEFSKVKKEYPSIKYEDKISGKVNGIYHLRNSKDIDSFLRLNFINGKKYSITAKNIYEDEKSLRDVCKVNSLLSKKENSDTLTVNFEGNKYFFVLFEL